jgi:hypothetical protein
MPDMAKKKTSKAPPPAAVPKPDAHQGAQIPFRVADERLVEALDAFAKSERRSRNMAIIILLEEALKARGFWPWPVSPTDPDAGT